MGFRIFSRGIFGLAILALLGGCAVVRLPVKAAGTVVGTTILAVTQSAYRPAAP